MFYKVFTFSADPTYLQYKAFRSVYKVKGVSVYGD